MRRSTGVLGLIAALALLFLAVSPAYADPPGNNGDVKIHEGAGESSPVEANDPHVCTFHIHGFNFDGSASGTWRIEGWPPTGGGTYNGTFGPADASGNWREPKAGAMSLPAGHYKLFVWQKLPNDPPGGPKQKVFWVDCGGQGGGGSGQAEKVRTELQAAISNATTVGGQLATEIGVAGQILATANLTALQRAAIETALAAATAAQTNLNAAITAANNTLAQLVTAIGSGNQTQISAAVNAALEAIANLNAKAGLAASANANLAATITANTSPAAQAQAQLANAIATATGVGTTLAGTIATAQGLNASGQLNAAGQAALLAALAAQTNLANMLTAAENALAQLTAAINSNVGVAAAVAAAAQAQTNLGAAVGGAVTANASLSATIGASSPTTTTTGGTTGTTTTAGSTNTESVTTAGMTGSSVVAGFETSPLVSAGSETATQGATSQTQGQTVAGVQNLPSTNTSQDTSPLVLLGAALMAVGGVLLRRQEQPLV